LFTFKGQANAVVSGCFQFSANRFSEDVFGGRGWIISPDGKVLATTSENNVIATLQIDLKEAESAKLTYPRYIQE
jgi:predicted amidohydrolase